MPLNKKQKKELIGDLVKDIGKSKSAVFVKFGSLTSADSNSIRSDLRKKGIGYVVSKKTLLRRALEEVRVSGDLPELLGQVAVAYGEDMIMPAKSVAEFQLKIKDKLTILGGVLEGKYVAATEMIALSKIPSREVLLGKLVNILNSPIQGFVMSLDQIAKKKL